MLYYEYWCFLKIHSLLKQKYELIRLDIIRVRRNGLFVTLDRSQKASVYWIPLKRLTQEQALLTELQYIGLYQSRRIFGSKEGGIHWLGKIKSWQVVRRYEVIYRRPHPGTENELYVLFQIEAWDKRREPIKPGGYGIYTHCCSA